MEFVGTRGMYSSFHRDTVKTGKGYELLVGEKKQVSKNNGHYSAVLLSSVLFCYPSKINNCPVKSLLKRTEYAPL